MAGVGISGDWNKMAKEEKKKEKAEKKAKRKAMKESTDMEKIKDVFESQIFPKFEKIGLPIRAGAELNFKNDKEQAEEYFYLHFFSRRVEVCQHLLMAFVNCIQRKAM